MESIDQKWPLIEFIQGIYEAPTYHLLLEVCLFVWVLWLLLRKSYKPKVDVLTEQEKEDLINEWKPQPLVPKSANHSNLKERIISGQVGKFITVNGQRLLNLASHNYLGFADDAEFKEVATQTLRKYGCGSCGPRGFYGTVDVHLDLEAKIAKFLNVEESVLYSFGFSTVASTIPAYSKRGDIIFADECVHFAIQKGLIASRSTIRFFKHNDPSDLRRLLEEQLKNELQNPKKAKATRKFLVIEGLYMNTGEICKLPQLIELKNEFKVRLFIDESYSFGVLGQTGRGVREHFNVDPLEIDNISGSLENSLAAYGGFSAGTSFIVDHQRLSGLGYCFSASLPPLQAACALHALNKLEQSNDQVQKLRKIAAHTHARLQQIAMLQVQGDVHSPIQHLRFAGPSEECRQTEIDRLEKVVESLASQGYALTLARYLEHEELNLPRPSIRLTINAALEVEEIDEFVSKLQKVIAELA